MLPEMLAAMLAVIVFAMASAMLEPALIEVLLGSAVNGIIARISHQKDEPSLDR